MKSRRNEKVDHEEEPSAVLYFVETFRMVLKFHLWYNCLVKMWEDVNSFLMEIFKNYLIHYTCVNTLVCMNSEFTLKENVVYDDRKNAAKLIYII